jgi:hypothetical protein
MRVWEEESAKSQSTSSSSSKSKSRATIKEERKMSSMDSTTVPRAPSAYMLFCRDERPKVLDPETGMKLPFVETTQRLATLWRECDDTVKEKYQQLAMIEKARLQQFHHDSTVTKHQ